MRATLLVTFVVFAACGRPPPNVMDPVVAPVAQTTEPMVVGRIALGRSASGVTVDSTGKRFVWVRGDGLYRVTADGLTLELAASRLALNPLPEFEDVTLIDANRIALIARNEGYVFGRTTGQLYTRFCYLPDDVQQQDPTAWQLSRALAYDEHEDRLYVQPQTFTGAGVVTGSQLGLFDPGLPTPLEWQSMGDLTFAAGGMAVDSRQRTFLGMDTRLDVYDAAMQRFGKSWDLGKVLTHIDGLAFDRQSGNLLVLDDGVHELIEVKLE